MKKLVFIGLLAILSTQIYAQSEEVIRLSEPVIETETYEVFGAAIDEWNEVLTLKELIESSEIYSKQKVTLETEVAEVCQKKGCFFVAREGSNSARITFKDYEFFVPTDTEGKTVKLVGMFEVKELTEEQAKHYAEDAGENPDLIEGPQKDYAIVATSVLVPKS